MSRRACANCGKRIPEQKTGRPRKYCSGACKKRDQRAALRRLAKMTPTDRKVFAVWSDNTLRRRWVEVQTKHEALIAKVIERFVAMHDLPAEISGTTAVIQASPGEIVYRFEHALTGTSAKAIAELVHDHPSWEITEAMVTNRVHDRLMDDLRDSDEYERADTVITPIPPQASSVTITSADGSQRVEKQPIRPSFKKRQDRRKRLPTRSYSPKDLAGERATAAVERRRRIDAMPLLHRFIYFVYTASNLPPGDVARVLSTPSRTTTATEVQAGLEDPFGPLTKAMARVVPVPHLAHLHVKALLLQALEWVGEDPSEDLMDDGGERQEDLGMIAR
jgi:hypothetical protein